MLRMRNDATTVVRTKANHRHLTWEMVSTCWTIWMTLIRIFRHDSDSRSTSENLAWNNRLRPEVTQQEPRRDPPVSLLDPKETMKRIKRLMLRRSHAGGQFSGAASSSTTLRY